MWKEWLKNHLEAVVSIQTQEDTKEVGHKDGRITVTGTRKKA
jgi:hypothetical protein